MTDRSTPDPMLPDPLDPEDATDAEDAASSDALKPVRGESVAAAVGSFMAGIEQQVFQRRPPAVELVQEMQHARGITGDGLEITLHIPDLPPAPDRSER
jgi:hypothetical protein